jgi:hypothetical protein
MAFFFSITLFLSAFLMFWAEPMFGKMALPFLGGSPSVWNTCMVFYQSVLLIGYSYAHLLAVRATPGLQKIGYAVLLLLSVFVLPISIAANAVPGETDPVIWLIALLTQSLGLPFLALACTSPLLQRWFAVTGKDPYFLFAAGNAGSLTGLLAYSLLIEQLLTVREQTRLWAYAYYVLISLVAVCAWMVQGKKPEAGAARHEESQSAPPTNADRLWWLALSFAPSSMLLGLTSYLSVDIAPVPLLWVVPLALYLLTFVIAFGKTQGPITVSPLILVVMTAFTLFMQTTSITEPLWLIMLLHIGTFCLLALACHSNLAQRRPAPNRLTEFYFFVALGGALGGIFNAIIAPSIFDRIIEYRLAVVLAFALIAFDTPIHLRRNDWLWPSLVVAVGAIVALLVKYATPLGADASLGRFFMWAFFLCALFAKQPQRAALGFTLVLFGTFLLPRDMGSVVYSGRNFFGVKKVVQQGDDYRWLVHGTTYHGGQSLHPDRQREPLAYYHADGPVGDVFRALSQSDRVHNIAIVGLGTGAMASYAVPGQKWTYYEIDPSIAQIAQNDRLFSFLSRSQAPVNVVLGDARLKLQQEPDKKFDLIVIDAFGSDAIPVHLITREAVELYERKLSRGLLLFHISNQNYDLAPVLANIAADAGLTAVHRENRDISEEQLKRGPLASHWVLMYKDPADALQLSDKWEPLKRDPNRRTWTDDYSDVLSAVKWVQ